MCCMLSLTLAEAGAKNQQSPQPTRKTYTRQGSHLALLTFFSFQYPSFVRVKRACSLTGLQLQRLTIPQVIELFIGVI